MGSIYGRYSQFAWTLAFALCFPLASTSSLAQTLDDIIPDFSPEEEAGLRKQFGQYSSAVTVFTGRNSASTGNFSQDNGDEHFSVFNVPYTYRTGDKADELRYEARIAVGQLDSRSTLRDFSNITTQIEDQLPPEFGGENNRPDFVKARATTLTVGTGAAYQPIKGLVITPGFDFLWTHVKQRFDYNNFTSAVLGLKFDRDVFNNSTESISYSPNIDASYEVDLGCGYTINPSATYTHIWTDDLWSKSQYGDFSISSGVLHTKLAANIPLPYTVLGYDLSFQPSVRRTTLYKAVRTALGEDAIYDFGGNFALDLGDSNPIRQFRVGGAYLTADNLSGYRVDVGIDF